MNEKLSNSLQIICKEVNKKYGAGAVMKLTERPKTDLENIISTGSISLDTALGIGGYPKGRIVEIYGNPSAGKAQPLSSNILTPTGWKEMKDIVLGDSICVPNGEQSTIVGIFPQGIQDVYKVTLDDKSFAYCTLDHLWFVSTRFDTLGEVLTTKEILEKKVTQKDGRRKFKIPLVSQVNFEQKNPLPMDPYLLGLLLGDGSFVDSTIKFTTIDLELLDYITEILERDFPELTLSEKQGKCTYTIKEKIKGHEKTRIYKILESFDLIGKLSKDKHIPNEYLYSNIENRTKLLQGLIDTDGSVDPQGGISFTTSSKALSKQFVELTRSLGFRCSTSRSIERVDGLPSYRSSLLFGDLNVLPAKLKRKANNLKKKTSDYKFRFIESIEYSHKEECQCIMVGHPDQLYITDNYIVTHNSTLCLHACAFAQKKGKACLYIDAEHAFDPIYAESLGISLENLYISQPSSGEEALNIALDFAKSGEVSLIVIDSVASLIPQKELEGEVGDASIGGQARMMSQGLRMITPTCAKSGTTIIFCNQVRQKIGVMFGNPNTTSGGLALPFYASVRLEIARTGDVKDLKEGIVGNTTRVKVVKNKTAPPKKEAHFNILFGRGVDQDTEIVDLAVEDGIIGKSGAWYKYEDLNIAQGLANCVSWLNEDLDRKEKIRKEILSNRGIE